MITDDVTSEVTSALPVEEGHHVELRGSAGEDWHATWSASIPAVHPPEGRKNPGCIVRLHHAPWPEI
jgi:hypothetical protein